ncbi:SigE family RNA polymerase sigma factor [Actinobacteria bacterium YIM 96077]|uniref:SigE family RNA polymerase sigma factor n=1 Tax=Phytoactinopolyspora halophila TaxID=1981511 RepID=A0A329QU98_9ACTN|nr:SigE family RNA polymerase sigma factor [Phytoactinopolyspora halophila]AYY13825.1 SigE family RNA polymerase sigma factor [Actinobacteria bacterium YIM 96077]RAW15631.1 SigE family RNA polymerase sigma factor [Phytoactinopolyspora halophila]
MNAEKERQFREFVEARSLHLRRAAYALCGDIHAAEDLVQGALVKLVRRWHKVDDPERYVRRIIYHDHASRWRRRAKIREDPVEDTPERGQRDAAADVNLRLDLRQALLRLAPRQRAVLVLRFYHDLPERDIADTLNCSVGTVRSQTHRALARLRELAPELDAHYPDDLPATEEASA